MNDEAARQGRPDTSSITSRNDSNVCGARLTLASLSFALVELWLEREDEAPRLVRVAVGSGPSWSRAVRFPTVASEASATTGDEALDAEIRRRTAEELVRLEAAVSTLRRSA